MVRGAGRAAGTRFRALVGPLVFSSTAPTLGNSAVIAVVGHLSADVLYLRSAYGPIAFVIVAVCTGTAVALQTYTARRAHLEQGVLARGLVGSALTVAATVYAAVALVLVMSTRPVAAMLGVPPDMRGAFASFFVATVAAGLLMATGEALAGVLRGSGRTGRGALLTATAVVGNVGAAVVVGPVLGHHAAAIPAGLAVAGLLETGLALVLCARAGLLVRAPVGPRGDGPVRAMLGTLGQVGVPVAGSYVLLFVVNLAYLHVVGASDVERVSGFSIGYTVQTLALLPGIGVGTALAITVNRLDSLGRPDEAQQVFARVLRTTAAAYVALGVVVAVLRRPLVALFTSIDAVAAEAERYLAVAGVSFGVLGFVLVVVTLLEQIGKGFLSLSLTVVYFAVVIGVGQAWTTAAGDTVGLYATMAITTFVAGPAALLLARRVVARRPLPARPGTEQELHP